MITQCLIVYLQWMVGDPVTGLFDCCTIELIADAHMLEIKKTREMDTTLSMRDRLYMRYRYFNDFRHGISVFVNFSLLYWVPPNAPSFTHYLPPLWDIFHYPPLKEIDWKSYEIVKCLASISVMKNVGEWASESGGWVGEMVTYQ